MRILFVHERFGAFGGAEANILATGTELRDRGHTVALLHGPRTGKSEDEWLHTFQSRFPLLSDDGACASLAAALFQPDVLYVHKLADLHVLEVLLDAGLPVVRMVHDHDLYCMRGYKYNYFTRNICCRPLSPFCIFPCGASVGRNRQGAFPLKWVSYTQKVRELDLNRRCHRLVVASKFMKQELLRNGFEEERIEVRPPVPREGDACWRSSFSDRNFIVYAGQIIRGKGVDVLLESLARVQLPFKCLIFGDGDYRSYCERLSRKLGMTHQVHFKGYTSAEEMAVFYREASVAVVSSVWPEPFGAVGLEAMRYGLPTLAFDAGGIREWLIDGHNGFLVPWMDREAFATRVQDLLGNKTLARKLGENGRQMVAEQFGFAGYVSGLEQLFSRLGEKTSHPVLV